MPGYAEANLPEVTKLSGFQRLLWVFSNGLEIAQDTPTQVPYTRLTCRRSLGEAGAPCAAEELRQKGYSIRKVDCVYCRGRGQ